MNVEAEWKPAISTYPDPHRIDSKTQLSKEDKQFTTLSELKVASVFRT
jgi:hypothetical protein